MFDRTNDHLYPRPLDYSTGKALQPWHSSYTLLNTQLQAGQDMSTSKGLTSKMTFTELYSVDEHEFSSVNATMFLPNSTDCS